MQWFKHMSNMRHDVKIRRLITKFGIEGYGLYNIILESIVEKLDTNNPIPSLEENSQDIANFFNIDTLKVEEIIKFCIDQGLLEQDDVTGYLLCKKIYKFIEANQTKSIEIRNMIKNYKRKSIGENIVYIIKSENYGYKIGVTKDIERRFSEIKSQFPFEISLYAYKKDDKPFLLENNIHKNYKDKKIKNEWFNLSKQDLNEIVCSHGFSEIFLDDCDRIEKKRIEKKRIEKKRKEYNRFIKPTKQQLQEYLTEIEFNLEPEKFLDYYESKDWMIGKNKMKCWKSAVRNWKRNQHSFQGNSSTSNQGTAADRALADFYKDVQEV